MDAFHNRTFRFVVAAGLLVAALALVSRGTRPPLLPSDASHRNLASNRDCAPCHAEGAEAPLSRQHPPKDDCLRCHRQDE